MQGITHSGVADLGRVAQEVDLEIGDLAAQEQNHESMASLMGKGIEEDHR